MSGVMYNTKSNNEEVERVLEDPTAGRDLIRKLMIGRGRGKNEPGIIIETANGAKRFTVKELTIGSTISR